MHPRTSRRNDYCSDQQSFHQLLKVVDENGLEWRAIVRKEHLGGTKKLKMLFKQRKSKKRKILATRQIVIWFAIPVHWDAKSGNFCNKEIQGEVIGRVCGLDSNYFSANKVFWQTIRRLRGKRSSVTYSINDSAANILTDEKEILSRWREYFEDLLNPVKASTRDTHEVTHLGEEEVFSAAEVATEIKGMNSGKAAGEDEIRPEILKVLTGEEILWLTRVCQVAW